MKPEFGNLFGDDDLVGVVPGSSIGTDEEKSEGFECSWPLDHTEG